MSARPAIAVRLATRWHVTPPVRQIQRHRRRTITTTTTAAAPRWFFTNPAPHHRPQIQRHQRPVCRLLVPRFPLCRHNPSTISPRRCWSWPDGRWANALNRLVVWNTLHFRKCMSNFASTVWYARILNVILKTKFLPNWTENRKHSAQKHVFTNAPFLQCFCLSKQLFTSCSTAYLRIKTLRPEYRFRSIDFFKIYTTAITWQWFATAFES